MLADGPYLGVVLPGSEMFVAVTDGVWPQPDQEAKITATLRPLLRVDADGDAIGWVFSDREIDSTFRLKTGGPTNVYYLEMVVDKDHPQGRITELAGTF